MRAQQKSAEGPKSIVPSGREKDYPNIVFNEQVMGALAKQLNIDLGASRAFELEHDDESSYKGFGNTINGLKSRIQ